MPRKQGPEDHWSCIAHLSAEDISKSAVIEEKKFKHSPWAGAENPLGHNFDVNRKAYDHYSNLLQVEKESLQPLTLYTYFHDLINVYSRRSGADNPFRTNFLCQQEHLVTLVICCKFKKISLKSDFIQFFHDFLYIYITPGQGQTAPRGQNFDVNRKVLIFYPFVASFKEMSLKSDFIHFFS